MSDFIDFEEVKAACPIEKAVVLLELEMKEANNQLRGDCPICEGGPRILCVTPSKNKFYCFGCKTGGDQIALVAHIRGEHPKDAAHYLVGTLPTSDGEKSNKTGPKPSEGFQPLTYLQPDHEAVEALGIAPEDAERIGLGYAPRGLMRGQVAIPIRLQDGQLIGYIGVTEAVLPKEWRF